MNLNRPTLSINERNRRWDLVRTLMQASGVDCLVVAGLSGIWRFDTYLASEHADGIVIFPLQGEPTYLTWTPAYITRHTEILERFGGEWISNWQVGSGGKGISLALKEQGFEAAAIGVIGLGGGKTPIEADGWIPYDTWAEVLRQLPNARFVNLTPGFIELMLVKSEEELALVRYSADVGELACEAMLQAVRDGKNENEILADTARVIFAHGCDINPGPFVHSGIRNLSWGYSSWFSQAQPPRIVPKGGIVQSEIFVNYGGIQTQQQMSIALGPVEPVCLELAEVVRSSYEAGVACMHPGRTFGEVADAMEVPLQNADCWHLTPLLHSISPNYLVGHIRVGMERMPGYKPSHRIQALPVHGRDCVLEPGMCIELEPNACIGSWRVNIGGTVIVTENGPEELNQLPTRMQVVA